MRFVAIPLVLAFAWAIMLGLDHYGVMLATYSLKERIGITALALLPLGFVLGMPFPTALSRAPDGVVPWAIAANGFMSVLGASAALPLAMLLGYRWLFFIASACYLLAALVAPSPAVGQPVPARDPQPAPLVREPAIG